MKNIFHYFRMKYINKMYIHFNIKNIDERIYK